MKDYPVLPIPESIQRLIERLTNSAPEISTTVNINHCAEAAKKIQHDSKFAYVLMNSCTFDNRTEYRKIRQELIEHGIIKAVILTPSRMFEGTEIPVSVIVLGENSSDSVMLVNASKIFHEESKVKAILTDDDIDKIVNACCTETDFSKKVSISEISENDYSLSPPRYILPDLKNPVKFGSLVKSHRCSLQLSPEQREKVTSDEPTNWQYAQPRNIINGEIDTELPYLNEFRESYLNHQIKNGNLVISKLGSPLKVAVAEFKESQTVIGVGRLYIFDIDTEKADPHKIKKFLSSSLGQNLLNSCDTSMLMKNLTIDNILKISIPYDEVKI